MKRKRRKQEKAAFQMSMGFIIAVVFAIVLLTLALTWLRGMFEGFGTITDDLTQQAQSTLRDAFRTGESARFAVWPTSYSLERGNGIKLSAGIENVAEDGNSHTFVINVIPATSSTSTTLEEMEEWATFDDGAGRILINSIGYKFIEIRPSSSAQSGTYLFNVVSCYDCREVGGQLSCGTPPVSSSCDTTSDNLWGGSAQQVLINLE